MQRKLATALSLSAAAAALVIVAAAVNGSDEEHPADAPAPGLRTIESSVGTIIADADGYPVYRFDESGQPVADRRTDPRVDPLPERRTLTCDGGSPRDWHPVTYVENTNLNNIDGSLLGYLQRADGRLQLTIRGCPLYRYAGDRIPGQVNGHGVAGLWFAVTPAGTSAMIPANSAGALTTSEDRHDRRGW